LGSPASTKPKSSEKKQKDQVNGQIAKDKAMKASDNKGAHAVFNFHKAYIFILRFPVKPHACSVEMDVYV